ncbi:hypothetical protein SAMN04488087_1018 [Rhodothermus profundi]|uniref:Uncharacterized protein n=1 Tax=Rhodothermus profundi TaxID=633813 RepID=A0A1M6RZW1_9BACT|nr:hypothetical protein SAMN04488087_1018 [Rhodothermus profundi]
MRYGRHQELIGKASGRKAALVALWTHPFSQGMTARVQQTLEGSSLRLRRLPLLLLGLLVLLISLIG